MWQLHNKYIVIPIENGLMIVDQHVAHERVLYDHAYERMRNQTQASQQLLFPQTVELTAGDFAIVQELLPHFEALGFGIKPFGRNTVVVESVPADIRNANETGIVEEVLALFKDYRQRGQLDARDALAKAYSCKAAVKAGDKLTGEEMRSLIEQLSAATIPFVCPHGRPVLLRISLDELDRRFGRT